MKSVTLRLHPLAIAGIAVIAVPTIAIAAGTVLNPPVTISGTSTAPMLSATNSGSGNAINAVSGGGNAVVAHGKKFGAVGTTDNPSATSKTSAAGLGGFDNSADKGTLNIGVLGQSNHGTGVKATSDSGAGLVAISADADGAIVQSTNGFGAEANSANGYGILALSSHNKGAVVLTEATPNPALPSEPEALEVAATGGTALIRAFGAACPANTSFEDMSLDSHGNLVLCGSLTQHGNPQIVQHTSTGNAVVTYSPSQTLPTIEDFGQAQLVRGGASVPLDPAFAQTIDPRTTYLVFITPDGPNRGLYVTGKSFRGFTVRENAGGRSSLTFDYRIVAKPFNSHDRRLPLERRPGARADGSALRAGQRP